MNVCIIGLAFLTTASEIAEIKIQAGLNKSCVEAIMSRPKWTKEVHKQMTAFGLVGPGVVTKMNSFGGVLQDLCV